MSEMLPGETQLFQHLTGRVWNLVVFFVLLTVQIVVCVQSVIIFMRSACRFALCWHIVTKLVLGHEGIYSSYDLNSPPKSTI